MAEASHRMMTAARVTTRCVEVVFADGPQSFVPFGEIRQDLHTSAEVRSLELPNPYELVVDAQSGEVMELPWDFVRGFCDPSYVARVQRVGEAGRRTGARTA